MEILKIIALALAPTFSLAMFIYFADRYDKEPLKWLFFAFILGSAVTFIAAYYEVYIGKLEIKVTQGNFLKTWLYSLFGVGLGEEFLKFIILRIFFFNKKFNAEPINAIVYSIMIAMGFATTENIYYINFSATPIDVAIIRAITAVPLHAVCAVFIGYSMGKAKFTYSHKRTTTITIGICSAIILHALYDFFLFVDWISPIFSLTSIFILAISFITAIILIIKAQRLSPFVKKRKWLKKMLLSKSPEFKKKLSAVKEEIKQRRKIEKEKKN